MTRKMFGVRAMVLGGLVLVGGQIYALRAGHGRSVPADCGAAALQAVCAADGQRKSAAELRELTKTTAAGTTLLNLKEAAEALGYQAAGYRLNYAQLLEKLQVDRTYAILHLPRGHFVAVTGRAEGERVRLVDPPDGPREATAGDLDALGWRGNSLVLHRRPTSNLVSERRSIDLGRVPVGADTGFRFKLSNPSGAPISILQLNAGCGCIKLAATASSVPAGGEVAVEGAFRAGGAGVFRKTVVVTTSEGVLSVDVHGEAVALVSIDPPALTLRPDFLTDSPGVASARIRNDSDKRVSLTVASVPEKVTADLDRPVLEPGQSANVAVRVASDHLAPGRQEVVFEADHPHGSRVHLALAVEPAAPVVADPDGLRFGVVSRNGLAEPFTLTLSGAGLGHLVVDRVEVPAFLTASVRDQDSDRLVGRIIELRFKEERTPGVSLAGSVRVTLRHPASGRAAIRAVPVSGLIRD